MVKRYTFRIYSLGWFHCDAAESDTYVLASDFDAQVDAGMKLFEENEQLRRDKARDQLVLRDITARAEQLAAEVRQWRMRKGFDAIKSCSVSETDGECQEHDWRGTGTDGWEKCSRCGAGRAITYCTVHK